LVFGVVVEVEVDVDVDVALGLRREVEVMVGGFEGVVYAQRLSNESLIATCVVVGSLEVYCQHQHYEGFDDE